MTYVIKAAARRVKIDELEVTIEARVDLQQPSSSTPCGPGCLT
jgi:hypothetical protein